MARRVWTVLGLVVVAGILAAAAIAFWPAGAARAVASPSLSAQLVAQGRYLATAADCIACHSVEGGAPYAGGRAFKLPFGVIYSPNITPDRQTGIGEWTDAQFVRAVRHGVGRRGEELYPAFPYTSYARMSEADALALKAYLSTLPPVRSQVRENGLVFPFNQRPLMRFWKLLFMPRDGFKPDPARPADWNRGAYLVTALGHCGECHTPRNLIYGLRSGQALSGETMQGWTAWNITSDPRHGIGARSAEDIAAYLRYGYAPGLGAAGGPMKEAVDYSLSRLTQADLRAIAVYLKASPAKARGPEIGAVPASLAQSSPAAPGPSGPGETGLGRQIFEGACASCHAWNGEGQQTPMAALAGLPSVNDPHGVNVVQSVLRGLSISAPQGHAFMPAFGKAYSDAEIAAAGNYVLQRFGGRAGRITSRQVAEARRD